MPDFKPHRCEFDSHLMIRKSLRFHALLSKKLVSFLVFRPLVGESMSATTQFHRQLGKRAVGVEEADATRILATEFEPGESAFAEKTPKAFLGLGGFLASL